MAVLSDRQLNRATLQRQLLLERSPDACPLDVLKLLVGMQGQDPELPHIGLWNRLSSFVPADLDALLAKRLVARATLYRCTQHLLATEDYVWVRPVLQPLLGRMCTTLFNQWVPAIERDALAAEAARLLDGRILSRPELGRALQQRWPEQDGVWLARAAQVALPIVHPHPDGTWGKRGATPFALAEQWLGGPFATDRSARDLVLRYLAGFGPASVRDLQAWSGLTRMKPVVEELRPELVTYRNEHGAELFDLPGRELPDPDVPAPVRFLPGFDNVTFGYADRRRIIDDEHRPALVEFAAFTVDGRVRGVWKIRAGVLTVRPFGALTKAERADVEPEAEALRAFAGVGELILR
ncbi:winged helix DNA-binding domain-containing protein [Actinoplanes sp. NPDC089786]|uniref:winged helix DNA-binding domain-containing protein n=1 Tax=Actinoplanes sp. NPDC089786 TaxID=3155185 RepID=UPI003434F8B8